MSDAPFPLGETEAKQVLSLLERSDPAAQAALNGIALRQGVATAMDDAATVRRRLRQCVEEAQHLHTTTPPTTTCIEHAYGSAQRLSFQIKVF